MPSRLRLLAIACAMLSACFPASKPETPPPIAGPNYDFAPQGPCAAAGSAKLTIAVVSPLWQNASQPSANPIYQTATGGMLFPEPKVLMDVGPAMRSDFLELLSCRGYLARGPFDSFEAMVYPDREGSQLLLEPGLQVTLDFPNLALVEKRDE